MRRVVFDTNVLISAFLANEGKSAQILRHSIPFTLITSEEILAELFEKLHLPRIKKKYALTDALIAEYMITLREVSNIVQVQTSVTLVRDPDDNNVLACAIDGKADYVVTGDRDLLAIGIHQGITVLPPAQFLEILEHEHTEPNA